ncbi:MAG: GNAT family N-acetyltransferase [Chlorobi bacterium]|nr:GNAT family N-acetyltransferase [Chlorobiota bacterium]MCI0716282.1 GNAT family N-acetyltransferase [Chlorobiota bacterium]
MLYFLTSKRLGFRTWNEEDFESAFKMWGDYDVTRLIDSRGKLTEEDVRERLSNEIDGQKKYGVQYWPIFLLETGDFVGCCGLRPYDIDNGIYEIGFHICSHHWRKGYAYESALAAIDYAFTKLNLKALYAGHNPKNEPSKNILKKLGFKYVRDEYYAPTGLYHPSYILNINEWTDNK